jgi:hypothetical protein
VKDPLNYSFGNQKNSRTSSFKYFGIIICRDLSWADQVNYAEQKAWKALHFICKCTKGNSNTLSLAYTSLVHLILKYRAVCWDPNREGQVSGLEWVQKKADKFANRMNVSVLETLTQYSKIPQICTLFKWRTGM